MNVYGNTLTKINATVLTKTKSHVEIKYNDETKHLIPSLYIMNDIENLNTGVAQELSIETWFLKRQRIIPLF